MSAPTVPVAAKVPARGVLRVKVTGSGSYTIRAKGYRKTSTVTKTFRVKPGKYMVKAPGATVKPKKTLRVRKGNTTTVRIGFAKKTPALGPTPTPTPTVSPAPSEPPAVPGDEQTVVSDGGPLSVAVPGVTVEAPAGAIAAGQTLTVRKEPGMDLPRGGVHGSGLTLTTSQGQPAKPVTVTLSYASGAVERPLIVHRGQGSEVWVPEQTTEVAPGKVQSVWDSFSSGGLVDYFVYAVGNLTGNRASLPDPCRQPPSFVVNHDFSNDSTNVNDSLFSCHTTASSEDWVGVELTNNRGYPLMMRITGGQFDLTGASMPTSTVSALNQAISRVANLGSGKTDVVVLAPGSTTSVRIPRSDPRSTVSVQAQGVIFSSVAGAGLSLLGQDKRLETSVKLMDCIAAALHSLNTGSTIDEGLSAVRTCADAALAAGENSFVYFPDLSPAEFKKLASGLGKLAKAILVVDVGQRIADAWVDGLLPPRLEYTTEQRIRAIDPPVHPKTVNTYIARDPDTGRSVLVDRGRVTVIGSGTLFNCLARTRAVWDIANLKALIQPPDGTQISCYDEGPEWTYTPTAQGGNTGTNIILRDTNGNAWLINNAGEIQTIEDGGTYLCLATSNPVIWNTPNDKIGGWAHGGVPATCGPTGSWGPIVRVSTASNGSQAEGGNRGSSAPSWSPDGTRVAFHSDASNLVPGDTNNGNDVFIKTLATGDIARVSTRVDGSEAAGGPYGSEWPVWSPDGTMIAFRSDASNLVPDDTNNAYDVFIKNVATGSLVRVSEASDGTQANNESIAPSWSPDGSRIVFTSSASNLVPGDTNRTEDLFVKELATGKTLRVSTAADGTQRGGEVGAGVWSPDGTRIAFDSSKALVPGDTNSDFDVFVRTLGSGEVVRVNTSGSVTQGGCSYYPEWSPDGDDIAFSSCLGLVPEDSNNRHDVFVKALASGDVRRVSTSANGAQANNGYGSYFPLWSPDGKQIAFRSDASDLVGDDTNGDTDLFVKTLVNGRLVRVATTADAVEANNGAGSMSWSPEGMRVAFDSISTNLVADDTNGRGDVFVQSLP